MCKGNAKDGHSNGWMGLPGSMQYYTVEGTPSTMGNRRGTALASRRSRSLVPKADMSRCAGWPIQPPMTDQGWTYVYIN